MDPRASAWWDASVELTARSARWTVGLAGCEFEVCGGKDISLGMRIASRQMDALCVEGPACRGDPELE